MGRCPETDAEDRGAHREPEGRPRPTGGRPVTLRTARGKGSPENTRGLGKLQQKKGAAHRACRPAGPAALPKPRQRRVTEIRGPYYSPLGKRQLEDVLETLGQAIDHLKFAGGSFAFIPERPLREIIDLCHAHNVRVSTGGFIEFVLTRGGWRGRSLPGDL